MPASILDPRMIDSSKPLQVSNTVVNNLSSTGSITVAGNILATNQVQANTLQLNNLPTSSAGLPSGSVWRDAAAENVLKIVP